MVLMSTIEINLVSRSKKKFTKNNNSIADTGVPYEYFMKVIKYETYLVTFSKLETLLLIIQFRKSKILLN